MRELVVTALLFCSCAGTTETVPVYLPSDRQLFCVDIAYSVYVHDNEQETLYETAVCLDTETIFTVNARTNVNNWDTRIESFRVRHDGAKPQDDVELPTYREANQRLALQVLDRGREEYRKRMRK